ncbi:MAG: Stf0 family sulfotransferase [Rubricella sp.]
MTRVAIVLTEMRSGSNWITSLTDATGRMGTSGEWFAPKRYPGKRIGADAEDALDRIVASASTPEGNAIIRVFPNHLTFFHRRYGADALRALAARHPTTVLFLTRRDRLGQAVSTAKARQTEQWRSDEERSGEPRYDFELILRFYRYIEASYAWSRTYLPLSGLEWREFVYEDLLTDQRAWIDHLSAWFDSPVETIPPSPYVVQRDSTNATWRERFLADARERDLLQSGLLAPRVKPGLGSLRAYLKGSLRASSPF